MTVFNFPFAFEDKEYQASCHIIHPPPDKQYHITVTDILLVEFYGGHHIIVVKGEELCWGIPSRARGGEFMRALVAGLKAHPQYQ